jgi:Sec-independent protein translocase protein TatA
VLLLVVWIVVVVLAVVVLGGIAYGVLSAAGRLRRELEGAERDLRPVLADVQATLEAIERRSAQGTQAR